MATASKLREIPFRAAGPGEGYFEDDSLIRRVNRELVVAFSGARALLMQASHPVMFEGFFIKTEAKEAAHARLARTATIMNTIYFGRRDDADQMTDRVREVHTHINGVLDEPAGKYPAGTPYAADDPQFLLWTLAALVDSADRFYRLYVEELTRDERDALWGDYRLVGKLFGLQEDEMPATIEGFDAYMTEMVEGDQLCVTKSARDESLAIVLNPPAPVYMRGLVEAVNFIIIGSLPAKIRRGYGLSWDPLRETMRVGGAAYTKRVLLPLLPQIIRNTPVAGGKLLPGPPRRTAAA
ncbi:MAG: DUF2236 domain-containing protein [Solirubrobacteraceae bacterium]|jgi:uncharacterized protein (DUF2236 family)|nr:DUF2236 domain-containing protein [Solirubrobacteraceae bacterium]MDP4672832.1 DUF2236 domain-containing protein [Solirubrobacteraceae bacterium]MDP4920393.1 DUF2236 domain-containing protein [Solirubrobacteraceae bacterium]MDP5034119.1 DUF2236 domain-containing protein [Solirubrobacteraceae bacterium]